MKYNIIMRFGYAESQRLSYVPFASDEEFSSSKEAFLDLAKYFKEEFDKSHDSNTKKCCLANKEKGDDYCSKCGSSLSDVEFDPDQYMQFVLDISSCDLDSFHGDYIAYNDGNSRWEPSDIEMEGHKNIFVHTAENALTAAIGYPPYGPDIDEVFKDENGTDFSYWG